MTRAGWCPSSPARRRARRRCTCPARRHRPAVVATRSSPRGWRRRASTGSRPARRMPSGPGLVVNGSGEPYKVFTPFSKAWRAHGWPAPAPTPRDAARCDTLATTPTPPPRCEAALAAPDLPELPARRGGGRARRGGGSSATARSRHTRTTATDPTSTAPRGSRPTSSWASLHPRTLLADLAGRAREGRARRTRASWRGGSSTPMCCGTTRRSAWHDLRPELAGCATTSRRTLSRRGRPAARGTRSWMPGCASCSREGWMHNRVRMITASFLTKDLHVWWGVGARHFLDHLVDGDIASNNHGWQWVAGTGTDASPVLPRLQPRDPGAALRPRRRLRAAMGARAGAPPGGVRRTSPGTPPTGTRTATPSGSSTTRRSASRPSRASRPPSLTSLGPTFSPDATTFTSTPGPFRAKVNLPARPARPGHRPDHAGCRVERSPSFHTAGLWESDPVPTLARHEGSTSQARAGQYVRPVTVPVRRRPASGR